MSILMKLGPIIGLAILSVYLLSLYLKASDKVSSLEFKLVCQNHMADRAKEILDTVVGKPKMARKYDATQPEAKTPYLN